MRCHPSRAGPGTLTPSQGHSLVGYTTSVPCRFKDIPCYVGLQNTAQGSPEDKLASTGSKLIPYDCDIIMNYSPNIINIPRQ